MFKKFSQKKNTHFDLTGGIQIFFKIFFCCFKKKCLDHEYSDNCNRTADSYFHQHFSFYFITYQ